MNHSIYSADRRTHLKIVAVGLLSAILVAVIGMFVHVGDVDLGTAGQGRPADDPERALAHHAITLASAPKP